MNKRASFVMLLGGLSLAIAILLSASRPTAVRGKSSAVPLGEGLSVDAAVAQEVALADARVLAYTAGKRSEVFSIDSLGAGYLPAADRCQFANCFQVFIYNFDENATVSALVDSGMGEIIDVHYIPGMQPGLNDRLKRRANELIHNSPEVEDALGFQPASSAIDAMDASLATTDCGTPHLCVAATFITEDKDILWVFVDLTDEKIAGMRWGYPEAHVLENTAADPLMPDGGCASAGTVNQDGWTLNYEITPSDGFRVYNVAFGGSPVLTNSKLVEWHADYGGFGFRDAVGCTGSGGFPIFPFGTPVVNQLVDGFEIVQDFRMNSWGNPCNYRYEQHFKFYTDGSFRIVAGAFGKGCYGGTPANYKPVMLIDIAAHRPDNNQLYTWGSGQWNQETTEFWELQGSEVNGSLERWMVLNDEGGGYYIEPGQGQFGDDERGDFAYFYATVHHASEGDADMGSSIGNCCLGDERQGPDAFVNGEDITEGNLVIWYVPGLLTDLDASNYYCWTVDTNETYPCFGGPQFNPVLPHNMFAPLAVSE